MATTKLWPVNNHLKRVQDYALDKEKTMADLLTVLSYAENSDKTEHQYYALGINCSVENAYNEFTTVKKHFKKEDGTLAWHGYMSFAPGECTPDEALAIGKEFAEKLWGDKHQVLVTVHLNTECLHCHFVVNSVSFRDGTRLRGEQTFWPVFRNTADEICKAHGKSVVDSETKRRNPTKRDRYVKYVLDHALEKCKSLEELEAYLKEKGHDCQFKKSLKYWTITPKGWTKPYRITHLEQVFPGENYSKEGIARKLEEETEVFEVPTIRRTNRVYPTREKYVEEYLYSFKYVLNRFLRELSMLCSHRAFAPLPRWKYQHKSRYSKTERPARNFEAEREVQKVKERLDFIINNKIYTEKELKQFIEKKKEELDRIEKEKELLEARAEYEKVQNELEALNNQRNAVLRELRFAKHYNEEDRGHELSGR